MERNYSRFPIINVIDGEYYQPLYEFMTKEYNENLNPFKKSSLHHFSDKLNGVLDIDITGCQIAVKNIAFLPWI